MGNSCSADFQKQFLSFQQRVEAKHLALLDSLYINAAGSLQNNIMTDKREAFFLSLIDAVAPQYTEEKRQILLQGWGETTGLCYEQVKKEVNSLFFMEFYCGAIPLRNYCIAGVKTKMPAIIKIETPINLQSESVERPSIAIACVLDNSGSMAGSRIKYARRAITKIIKHLQPSDTFHLVVYNSTVTVPIKDGDLTDKDALKQTVKSINTTGCTNICDALRKAASLLQTSEENQLRRLFLFSDGNANEGELQNAEGLSNEAKKLHNEHSIAMSSFGIGSGYNEAVMSGIAKQGGGDYYFIGSAADIPVTISKAIHGLLTLYGTNATLTLRGCGDGIVTQLFGKFAQHDLALPLEIGDLLPNDSKRILIEVEVASKEAMEPQPICSAILTFDRVDPKTGETLKEKHVAKAHIMFTSCEDQIGKSQNNAVYIAQMIQQTAACDRDIVQLLDKRDYPTAIARKAQIIEEMQAARKFDDNNELPKIIQRAEAVLQELKSKKDHAAIRKLVDYEAECEEMDDCFDYAQFSDSDDDCYSDDAGISGLHDFSGSDGDLSYSSDDSGISGLHDFSDALSLSDSE